MSNIIATTYNRWMRWQYNLNRRLRRGGLIGVLLVLSLAICNPLACVIHCAVIDALYPNQAGHAHQTQALAGAIDKVSDASHFICHFVGDTGKPIHTPLAQALYELAFTALVWLISPVLLLSSTVWYAAHLVWRPRRPPLRPPRFA